MKANLGICLAVMMLVCVIVSPVMARDIEVTGGNIDISKVLLGTGVTTYTYNADPDERISIIEYDIPLNTRVDFTLTYGTGSTVSGWMEYKPATAFGLSNSTVSLDTDYRTENFVDAQVLGYSLTKHIQFESYGVNKSASPVQPGFTLYAQGYGLFSQEIVFFPVNNITANMITGVYITSTQNIDVTVNTNKADKLADFITKSVGQYQADIIGGISQTARDWINFAIGIAYLIYYVVTTLVYWLKFFFYDNLGMTIALYLSISMAYSAATSKSIFRFFGKFFNDQRKLFEFILGMWRFLVELVATFRGIFRI